MKSFDESVFHDKIYPHFERLSTLRRPSNDEEEAVDFLAGFAEKNGLRYERDTLGNLMIYRDAAPGYEDREPLMFQGHTDMVSVPDKNIWPINLEISDGWVHTGGKSTLGADNGIAIAMMMELMVMPLEKNPPLEFMLTVAEEVGLVGASGMETDKFSVKAPRMVNIDSEDIQFITVGCAGAKDMDITMKITTGFNERKKAFRVAVHGPGGHSGLAINDKIPNAIKIAAEFVKEATSREEMQIASFTGGLARNAIPADAEIIFTANDIMVDDLRKIGEALKGKYSDLQDFTVEVDETIHPKEALTVSVTNSLLDILQEIPHGVVKMNEDTGGVLSSNNLALVEQESDKMKIILSARSSDLAEVDDIFNEVTVILIKYNGIEVQIDDGYPGWRPDMDAELLKATVDAYESVMDRKAEYLDIHAGLECGILMDTFPQIKEAVSIGPNLHHAHSVKEKLEISSTVATWEIVMRLIEHYAEK